MNFRVFRSVPLYVDEMWTPPTPKNGTDRLSRNIGRAHVSSFVKAKVNQSLKTPGQALSVPGR